MLALVAALGAVLATPPAPAYAHAQLTGTTPANGERLASSPPEVVLRFSERVNLVRDGVMLLSRAGPVPGTGPARIDPAEPTQVRLPVSTPLREGAYTVSWRVVSADSHPLHGAFVFAVGDAEIGQLPDAGARTDADPALSATFWLFRWLGYAALALLAGGVCFVVLCWPTGWAQRRPRRLIATGWAGSLVSAAAVLLLQGAYATGGSLARAGEPALVAATLATDYGRYVVARLGLLVLGGALLVGAFRAASRARPLGTAAAVLLAGALPATWAGTGHANAQASLLAAAADTAHLSAMAVWFGGLVGLLLCVLPQTADRPLAEVATAVTRFSRVATVCVATLVGTGVYQAWREVGSLAALSGSTYGTLLVFKLGAVGVLLWLGAMSRSVVRRRYLLPAVEAAGRQPAEPAASRSGRRAARASQQQELLARRQLGWSVRAEIGIAVGVLALTAMLVATPPAARPEAAEAAETVAAPAPPQAAVAQLALPDGGRVDVRLDPARSGPNSLTLRVRRADGTAWDVPEVRAALLLAERDLGPLPVELTKDAPGEYRAPRVELPVPGAWRLQVTVRMSEIDQTTVGLDLPVS